MSQTEYAYFEGQIVPLSDAKISIKTHAFLYGTSIFEGIRAYWVPEQQAQVIFRMNEHYVRLYENSRIFQMAPPVSIEEIEKTTVELLKKNAPTTDTYIRPTLYKAGDQVGPALDKSKTEFCVWTTPLGAYVDINKGLSVCVSSWRRVDDNALPPRAKAGGAYMNTALIVTEARQRGFDDAIVLTQDGHVSEGSAMNLFLARRINGTLRLMTPAITENILEGITRDTIIELAQKELGITVEERVIDRTELYRCEEAFFCGTGAQVAPITQIDNRPVGSGEAGELSRQLQELYFKVVKNQLPRYSHWCTVVPIAAPVHP